MKIHLDNKLVSPDNGFLLRKGTNTVHTHIHVHTYTCTYMYIHIHVHTCIYIYMYIHTYMYIHVYNIYTCTYIHIVFLIAAPGNNHYQYGQLLQFLQDHTHSSSQLNLTSSMSPCGCIH